MLADVMRYLRCPHCARTLVLTDGCVSCAAGHTFDVARQGYVSLLPGDAPGNAGDTPAMVQAREEFLGTGHYAGLAERLTDAAASLVLDVFAPRNGPEFHRVLRPDGFLLVVTPTPGHLTELVSTLGLLTVDARKDERLARTFGRYFEPGASQLCEATVRVSHADVAAVATMGPSAWHSDLELLRASPAYPPRCR